MFVRMSKISCYENPYAVTGSIKQTGSKKEPKDICTDKIIGTQKVSNAEGLKPYETLTGKFD